MKLKLNNKDLILKTLNDFALKNKIEVTILMENVYKVVMDMSISFELMDHILFDIRDKLKLNTLKEAELEVFHVVSYELDRLYTETVLKNSDKKDIESVNNFLDSNYFEIFNSYYKKNSYISKPDYDDCVVSVSINFTITKEIAGILIGKWLDDNIIK